MAGPSTSRLQQMLQTAVQSLQWTYSLFWQLCPQQGVLIWGDGYYNGAIKTRKTVQAVEVSTEEASLQRSQQLKELYESLSAGETNPPARRPCAALSPEDLTESEWFYLMCVSFSFPLGVGLPGNAFVKGEYVWLTEANEADSKVFSRAILAKSAHIQTVMCIPLEDGVLELGTTEKIEEDIGLIHHARSFFTDQPHHPPIPALSEHSTSNPTPFANRSPLFHSPSLANALPLAGDPHGSNQEDEPENEDDDDDDDEEGEAISDSEADTGRESSENAAEMIQHSMAPVQAAAGAGHSEMMPLEMPEDIRLGSPDDFSNNLESELQMLTAGQMTVGQLDDYQAWPLHDDLSSCIPESSGASPIQDLSQEDSHYSQTVSAILQLNSSRCAESCSTTGYLGDSQQSAFSSWNSRIDKPLLPISAEVTSQWMLKYVLFSVPFLHSMYRDENSSKVRDGEAGNNKFRKGTPQEELSANHVLAERRRREKLNERFIILRSLVPFVTKMDKASILGDTIEYVKQLRRQIQDLESQNKQMGTKKRSKATEILKSNSSKDTQAYSGYSQAKHLGSDRIRSTISDKRKFRVLEEGNGTAKAKAMEASSTNIQVSIIETDALLELQCPYRDGLLLMIIQTLNELQVETITVQSSAANATFVAELQAKVKENIQGQRASIVEVKRSIQEIFFQ